MIGFLSEWLAAMWMILRESGPFLFIGFTLAGLIKVFVPADKVVRHLGRDDFRSVFVSSCAGVPIPLCSCSVIPTATALRRSGASKGATTSFLISTPETGVDSIGMTWAVMDPLMTFARPIAALLTALGAGSLVNLMVRRGWDDRGAGEAAPSGAGAPCCACGAAAAAEAPAAGVRKDVSRARGGRFLEAMRAVFGYSFGTLMADLTPWFIIGFVLSGLIMVCVPDDFLAGVLPAGWTWLSMLVMLVVGIPMYICATASTPVAAALVAKGLDPGAALVLLLAGPATNVATFFVVKNLLGRRVLLVYLGTIAVVSLALGGVVNGIYSAFDIEPLMSLVNGEESSFMAAARVVCGAALGLLLFYHALAQHAAARFGRWLRGWCARVGFDPTSPLCKTAAAAAVLIAYLATAFSVVGPGETGFLIRFGAVADTFREPGIRFHLPFPIDRVDIVRDTLVRGVEFGFSSEAEGQARFREGAFARADGRDLEAEAEVVTGDEKIVRVFYAVQYMVADAYRWRYGVEDPETLLRSLTETSLRRVLARRHSDEVLVADRDELQAAAAAILQQELDGAQAGMKVVALKLICLHAPPQTHYAYRDVASAFEDKQRQIRAAEGYQREKTARARGTAYRIEQEAEAARDRSVNAASGEVAAFLALLEALHGGGRDITLLRLRHEAAEQVLGGCRLVLLLDDGIEVRLYDAGESGPAVVPPVKLEPE
ncbi:MAG: SO_0444 family Cu/Zn efflux transporter [Planctomycetes bacterium]|nr:SO_0444 family Cu/Zn efflux transporter [Planctomycetota bacterium]